MVPIKYPDHLFKFIKGTDSELVKAWFDFIKSDEGKQVIEDVGLIPAE